MKKVFSLILSLVILITIITGIDLSAYAVEKLSNSGSCGNSAYYTFDKSTGVLEISGTGEIYKEIVLGFEYYEQPFSRNSEIKTVIINEGITGIPTPYGTGSMCGAFVGCENLTSVVLPDGFISIGAYAFVGCSSLSVITIPDSVTYIDTDAFLNCADDLTIYCSADSYAAHYAKANNINTAVHDGGHTAVIEYADVVEPTCMNYGFTENSYCTVCNTAISPKRIIPPTGHSYDDGAITKAATCYTDGRMVYTCTRCGQTKSEKIPSMGHTEVIDAAKEATCTENGWTQGSHCSVCGMVIKAKQTIRASGHNYEVSITPATASSDEITTYTCVNCGYAYSTAVSLDWDNFKVKAVSLSLEDDLTMNFKVPKTLEYRFKNLYIEFVQNGKVIKTTDFYNDGDCYVFSYRDIAPQLMNDKITATVYGTRNGILYCGESVDFSVSQYAYGMLERESGNVKLRTLLVDLLNYGAAAQIYQNYRTNDLANVGLTNEQKKWASSSELKLVSVTDKNYETVENAEITWKSVGLGLSNGVNVKYTFHAQSIDDVQFKLICNDECAMISFDKITSVNGVYAYDVFTLIDNDNGTFTLVLNGVYANMMRDEIYITAMRGEKAVSNTLRYSVESYAKQVQDKMPNSNLRKLTDAMMRYGISADDYVK